MDTNIKSAFEAAQKAVNFDKNEKFTQAFYYYKIAVNLLQKSLGIPNLAEKCQEYQKRIEEIQKISKFFGLF